MLIPFGVFSAGGASAGKTYELITSTILGSTAASVTFDVSSLASTYKHLQVRIVARSAYSGYDLNINSRFNSDTAGNYSLHRMLGDSGSVISQAYTSTSAFWCGIMAGALSSSNIYGSSVYDILDFASTSKYKTGRSLTGVSATNKYIQLISGSWRNTNAVTSITLFGDAGDFASGSRFSLYGIRG